MTPWTVAYPGSSVHGILQAGILEWVAIPFSGDLPDPGIEHKSPALQADSLPSEPPGKPFLKHRNDRFSVLFKYLFSLNADITIEEQIFLP